MVLNAVPMPQEKSFGQQQRDRFDAEQRRRGQ
jgi:hypothetical protein